jgi:type I restriction enzyme R subunit
MYVDRRLAGIQAVQTLSRLNRAHPGKDTTYILDFVNDSTEILESFKTYYATAELSGATDPNIVLDLRIKLDATGYYDDFEVNRVVEAELNPNPKQKQLEAAIAPVAQRLLNQYAVAKTKKKAAEAADEHTGVESAQEEMASLDLFRKDMISFQRMYSFLSQIFDYGNTDIEKRAIFYRRLIPLLKFGREREGVDLSGVVLTHYKLRDTGKQNMNLHGGETPKLYPLAESGSGLLREQNRDQLDEIIARVNELFQGELSDSDRLIYVNNVIRGKLLESSILRQQACSNSKEQFANSPDLMPELTNAIIEALDVHNEMSAQVLGSEQIRRALLDILLGPSGLYDALRGAV